MARDAFQLVQEAVALWESLDGVARVDVVEEWLGNTGERDLMARVTVDDQPEPIFVQFTTIDPWERMEVALDDDMDQEIFDLIAPVIYGAQFNEKLPVRWRDESWE